MYAVISTVIGVFWGEIDSKSEVKDCKLYSSVDIAGANTLEELFLKYKEPIITKINSNDENDWVTDSNTLYETLKGTKNIRYTKMGELKGFRTAVNKYIKNLDDYKESEYNLTIKKFSLNTASFSLKKRVDQRDIFIAQSIKSIDDINTILNTIYARLSEWYSLHFPELQELARDNEQYIKLVHKLSISPKEEISKESFGALSDKRQDEIIATSQKSLGGDMDLIDLKPITDLASFGVEIIKVKERLEEYIDEAMTDVAPNLQSIVGSLLGARLISLSGSLRNLAKSPASTVQVLGAERSLFRHIKTGDDPPKHGVIFQSALIHASKLHQRGKIARVLAGKLAIASRVDFFTGEFIGDILKADIEKKVEDIKKKHPTPSEKQLTRKKPVRKSPKKPRRRQGKDQKRYRKDDKGQKYRKRRTDKKKKERSRK